MFVASNEGHQNFDIPILFNEAYKMTSVRHRHLHRITLHHKLDLWCTNH